MTRWLTLMVALVACTGCTSYWPDFDPADEKPREGDKVVGDRAFRRKDYVACEGVFSEGRFLAQRIAVKKADKEVEVKAAFGLAAPDGGSFTVGGIELFVVAETKLVDEPGAELLLADFKAGDWVKTESVFRNDRLELRKAVRRERKDGEREKLAGEIVELNRPKRSMSIGGVDATYPDGTLIVWDKEEPAPEALTPARQDTARIHPSVARVKGADPDEVRPDTGLGLGDFMVVHGELGSTFEWRDNFDLRDDLQRDRAVQEIAAVVEAGFDIERNVGAFVKLRSIYQIALVDEQNDLDLGENTSFEEAFIVVDDAPFKGMSLQVGRQDFDHGREWLFDHNLDAARLYLNFDDFEIQMAAATVMFDAATEDRLVDNYLLAVKAEPFEKHEFFFYGLHRMHGDFIDLDRTHVGASLNGKFGDFEYWVDAGYAWGEEEKQDVGGWGVDFMAMYVWDKAFLEPSVFAGFAHGSGDSDPADGSDGNFRQSGLHDNQMSLNGVTSFRYLGELVRPDLSNLSVLTFGIGLRPFDKTSIDLVFHRYWQVERYPIFGQLGRPSTRLRLNPSGLDEDIGSEVDLIIGFEHLYPFEVKFIAGYFHPGDGMLQPVGPADDAWWVSLQLKINF